MHAEIRSPHPSDVNAIAELHHRCWGQTYAALLPPEVWETVTVQDRREFWRTLLASEESGRWLRVADLGGELVGFAVASLQEPQADLPSRQLHSLYVLADHHGCGTGQQLLDAVVGGEPAQLWVAEPNARARAFYRRNGFVEDGATDTHHFGETPVPAVRMVRATRRRYYGQCLCGAVQVEVAGPLRPPVICHCIDCRRWHGTAPAYVAATMAQITVTGEVVWYERPDWPCRGFCRVCGSTMFWDAPERDGWSIVAGIFDQPLGLAVVGEIFTEDRADYDSPPNPGRLGHWATSAGSGDQ